METLLEEANTTISALTKQSEEALNHQKGVYDKKLSQMAESQQQISEALERKLKAQSLALQQKDGTVSELSQRLEAQQEETQLLLEGLTKDHETEIAALSQKHDAGQDALRQDLEAAKQLSKQREEILAKEHEDELWTMESRYKDEVKRLVAQADRLKGEKDKALEDNSAEYCQQLTAVALEHQKAVDRYHTQLRTLEAESQQAQVC